MNRTTLKIYIILALLLNGLSAFAGAYDDLLAAIRLNDISAAEALFARGMDVNTTDPSGSTLLMIAIQEDHTELATRLL